MKGRGGEGRPSDAEWEATKLDAMLAFNALLCRDDGFWDTTGNNFEAVFMAGYRAGMRRANQMLGGK